VVIAAIPVAEFTTGLYTLMLNIAVISVVSLIVCVFIIFLLLKLNVVKEMKKLLSVLKKIGDGNLKEKAEVRSSVEFIEFSNGINQMSDNLNGIITDNIRITALLAESAEKLAESADQTSRGAEEVATTINELAQGANEQAESATKGATLAKEALAKLEAIAENIRQAVTVTNSHGALLNMASGALSCRMRKWIKIQTAQDR
jgi:methyl-accepting chemotaxis protein